MPLKKIFIILIGIISVTLYNSCGQRSKSVPATNTSYYGPGGTYSDWYFPKGKYESMEWTFVPITDPPNSLTQKGLLHYYAYNFAVVNTQGKDVKGGYCGFQTNGIFKGKQKGKVINYSIWDSNGGITSALLHKSNEESNGFQIMFPYEWAEGNLYAFQLKRGPSGTDNLGTWWGLWVTDKSKDETLFVGEIRVPPNKDEAKDLWLGDHTSMFGEDLHWWLSLNGNVKYTTCTTFEPSAMAARDITVNGTIKPLRATSRTNSGEIATADNGFKTINCAVTIYHDSLDFNVQHNLGYWPTGAPNSLEIAK